MALILDAGALVAVERRDHHVRSLIVRNELRGRLLEALAVAALLVRV